MTCFSMMWIQAWCHPWSRPAGAGVRPCAPPCRGCSPASHRLGLLATPNMWPHHDEVPVMDINRYGDDDMGDATLGHVLIPLRTLRRERQPTATCCRLCATAGAGQSSTAGAGRHPSACSGSAVSMLEQQQSMCGSTVNQAVFRAALLRGAVCKNEGPYSPSITTKCPSALKALMDEGNQNMNKRVSLA